GAPELIVLARAPAIRVAVNRERASVIAAGRDGDELERLAHSDGFGVVIRRRRRHPGERAHRGTENPERARILRHRGAPAETCKRRENADVNGQPNEPVRAAHVAMLIERRLSAISASRGPSARPTLKRLRTRREARCRRNRTLHGASQTAPAAVAWVPFAHG